MCECLRMYAQHLGLKHACFQVEDLQPELTSSDDATRQDGIQRLAEVALCIFHELSVSSLGCSSVKPVQWQGIIRSRV